MELNNLEKNEILYLEGYEYIPSNEIKKKLTYVEAGIIFTYYFIKDRGVNKMLLDYFSMIESKVLNECKNKQLNKVEYEDIKLDYCYFNSQFKHYYSRSLNANRENFQEHKNWIFETLFSEIKKSNDLRKKYLYVLDFKRGLFETLEFIHLIGGYEKILREQKVEQKQLERKELEEIESRRQEKIKQEEKESVLFENKREEKRINVSSENNKLALKILEKEKIGNKKKSKELTKKKFEDFFKSKDDFKRIIILLKENDFIDKENKPIQKSLLEIMILICKLIEMKLLVNLSRDKENLGKALKVFFSIEFHYTTLTTNISEFKVGFDSNKLEIFESFDFLNNLKQN